VSLIIKYKFFHFEIEKGAIAPSPFTDRYMDLQHKVVKLLVIR
jgi:hypothetical protein